MNRPMPTISWLELAVVAVIVVLWACFRPRPPWAGDGNIWRKRK